MYMLYIYIYIYVCVCSLNLNLKWSRWAYLDASQWHAPSPP